MCNAAESLYWTVRVCTVQACGSCYQHCLSVEACSEFGWLRTKECDWDPRQRASEYWREARHVRVVGFDRSSVKRVVERSFENSLYNKTVHVARVPSALLTQRLNEYLVGKRRWAGILCVCVCVCVAKAGRARDAMFKLGPGACWRGQKNGTTKNVGESQFGTLLLELCSVKKNPSPPPPSLQNCNCREVPRQHLVV